MSNLSPSMFLDHLIGKRVVIKSKWGHQFEATLISKDQYFNVHLKDCKDEGVEMDEVLIRSNNIMYVREVPEGQKATLTPW